MQKIKLFMVLALLVMGVSNVWAATQKFTVTYVGQTVAQGAGYTANTSRDITFRYNGRNYTAGRILTGYTATEFTVYGDYADYPSYYTNLLQTYITPTPIDDFNSAVTVSGTTVTITYTPKPENVLTWSDGDFTYSTYHIQQTGNQGYMDKTFDYYPGEHEVAISLNMNTSGTLEEVVRIPLFRIYSYYDGYVYFNQDGSVASNGAPVINNKDLPTTKNRSVTVDGSTYTYLGAYDYHGENWYETGNSVTYDGTDYEYSVRYFYYKRSFTGNYSNKTSVVIPKEVEHNGVTYKVTAIQKWGFCYEANDVNIRRFCSSSNYQTKDGRKTYTDKPGSEEVNFNDHRNDYLKTVSFESFSNIHSFGDYAFMSCKALESVQIPASVTYFGQGIFECCTALTDCRFQTLTAPMITYYNGLETSASTTDDTKIPLTDAMIDQVRWPELRNFTFWFCTALESLELPDGITKIDGQGYGASMQYMTSLKNVRLPNTLKEIGPHFLCCAMSLETLTIPASVTNIDGACFHGCESLESVYLLGPASALKTGTGETGEDTFGQNDLFCAEHVSDATFYCVEKYLSDYQNDAGWKLIDEHGIYNADAPTYGNTLTTIPIEKRVFPARWVTAIFPYQVDNYKSVFGANTRVAVMDPEAEHTVTTGKEQATGKQVRMYNIVFKLIPEDQSYIPAGTPVMICAGEEKEYALYSADQQVTEWFRLESTKEHGTPVTATDGAVITMKGKYVPYTMHPWDFYFMYKATNRDENGNVTGKDYDNPAKFYRVPDAENAATVGICRCYWTISMDGVKIDPTMTTAKEFFFDDEVDGIENVETRINIAGIYDLQGRKLDIDESELPQGLYIVNGKKLIKK